MSNGVNSVESTLLVLCKSMFGRSRTKFSCRSRGAISRRNKGPFRGGSWTVPVATVTEHDWDVKIISVSTAGGARFRVPECTTEDVSRVVPPSQESPVSTLEPTAGHASEGGEDSFGALISLPLGHTDRALHLRRR